MADSSNKSFLASLPLPGVMAILTAVAGTLLLQYQPLTPRRPLDEDVKPLANPNLSKIDASLLEDPFGVMWRVKLKNKPVPPPPATLPVAVAAVPPTPAPSTDDKGIEVENPEDLAKVILSRSTGRGVRQPVLILPMLTRPHTDAASSEKRMRMRQAVVNALYVAGYVAEDMRYLQVLRVPRWNSEGPQPAVGAFDFDIPFEWFYPPKGTQPPAPFTKENDPRHRRVLVLWVNNKQLGQQQLTRLRELMNVLLPPFQDTPDADPAKMIVTPMVKVMGPFETEYLGHLVAEKKDIKGYLKDFPGRVPDFSLEVLEAAARVPGSWPGRMEVISHNATASAESVLRSAGFGQDEINRKPPPEERLDTMLNAKSTEPPFIRTINTDDHVARALLEELERRSRALPWQEKYWKGGTNLKTSGRVAIISEMDTPYGRELPLMYREEARRRLDEASKIAGKDWKSLDVTSGSVSDQSIVWFPYFRGLDGRVSLAAKAQSKPSGDAKKGGTTDYLPDEEPVGANQSDSLRRLAAQIEEMHGQLRKEGGEGIVAIGVLGSDIFDKLMILRALRPRLPQSLFFTNNLDAWLWHKEEIPGTRNLIVGSPYGLSLAAEFQRGIPPFRDSYQTSAYAGTMAALGMIPKSVFRPESALRDVRLYEIGSSGPHELSLPSTGLSLHARRPDEKEWWDAAGRSGVGKMLVGLLVAGILIWIIVVVYGERAPKSDWPLLEVWRAFLKLPGSTGLVMLVSIPGSIWACYRLWGPDRFEGEPYAWWSGISVWPTESIRMVAVLLSLHFVWKSILILRESRERIEERYFKSFDETAPAAKKAGQGALTRFVNLFVWRTEETNPHSLWNEYVRRSQPGVRIARSLVFLAGLLITGSQIISIIGGDTAPVRGPTARVDAILDALSFFSLMLITAYVLDATWLGRSVVQRFAKAASKWDKAREGLVGRGLHADIIDRYLDLRVVGRLTSDMMRLAFFPFYVLGLMIFCRIGRFDNWPWPPGLLIVYSAVAFLIVFFCGLVRKQAEAVRREALKALRMREDAGDAITPGKGSDGKLAAMRSEVENLREGALAPFAEQPAMKSVFWMLGAIGAGGLWQYVTALMR
ncbi:MAG: hypothetical protein IPK22_11860 [Verrucomicrobiaceae bacterium]|nr:hypothetical protein [Verrucomicrobiaceae bacterium]